MIGKHRAYVHFTRWMKHLDFQHGIFIAQGQEHSSVYKLNTPAHSCRKIKHFRKKSIFESGEKASGLIQSK